MKINALLNILISGSLLAAMPISINGASYVFNINTAVADDDGGDNGGRDSNSKKWLKKNRENKNNDQQRNSKQNWNRSQNMYDCALNQNCIGNNRNQNDNNFQGSRFGKNNGRNDTNDD